MSDLHISVNCVYPGEDVVNIFDKNFTRINTTLSAKRTDLAGTKLGKNYVIFTGGYTRGEEYILTADIFNVDFIRTTISIFTAREKFTGASLGDEYAVFAGGWGDYINDSFYQDTLDVFDTNFTLNTTFTLSAKRQELTGASLGKDYVAFAGGLGEIVEEDGYVEEAIIANVDIFNMDFTRTAVSLSSERYCLSGASLGDDYVVFAGGDGYGDLFSKTVDIFNKDFVRDNSYNLSIGQRELTGASLGNEYAVFAGGSNWDYGRMDVVDIFGLEKINKKINKKHVKSGIKVLEPTILSETRQYLAGASLGDDYAVFAGGQPGNNLVDIFDKDFIRSNTPTLSVGRYNLAGASLGDEYVVFAGGWSNKFDDTVDIFDIEFIRTTKILSEARSELAGASLSDDCAIFAGGTGYSDVVDIFDKDLVRNNTSTLSAKRQQLVGVSLGNDYVIFAGGFPNGDVVDIFDKDFVLTTSTLSVGRYLLTGASLGNEYAVFAGGGGHSSAVDIFNKDFVRTINTLYVGRQQLAGTNLGDKYAVFAGGNGSDPTYEDTVDMFDNEFTRTTNTISEARLNLAGASLGDDCAVFAGGAPILVGDTVDIFTFDKGLFYEEEL